jgi:hypothetical protein
MPGWLADTVCCRFGFVLLKKRQLKRPIDAV